MWDIIDGYSPSQEPDRPIAPLAYHVGQSYFGCFVGAVHCNTTAGVCICAPFQPHKLKYAPIIPNHQGSQTAGGNPLCCEWPDQSMANCAHMSQIDHLPWLAGRLIWHVSCRDHLCRKGWIDSSWGKGGRKRGVAAVVVASLSRYDFGFSFGSLFGVGLYIWYYKLWNRGKVIW